MAGAANSMIPSMFNHVVRNLSTTESYYQMKMVIYQKRYNVLYRQENIDRQVLARVDREHMIKI